MSVTINRAFYRNNMTENHIKWLDNETWRFSQHAENHDPSSDFDGEFDF